MEVKFTTYNPTLLEGNFKEAITMEVANEPTLVALGEGVYHDFNKVPHLLVAGATGSGKSVMLHNIIASLLMNIPKLESEITIIDPKRVEMSIYEGCEHLASPIAKGVEEGIARIEEIVIEIENKYKLMEEMKKRKYTNYKEMGFPRHFIIIDEFADLMLTSSRRVENNLIRIAQLGRACGVHLVIATQRPSAKVVTGLIKSNIQGTICLRVRSELDSRIALGYQGAERLRGCGDAIYDDGLNGIRFQGAYLSDNDIEYLANHQGLNLNPL